MATLRLPVMLGAADAALRDTVEVDLEDGSLATALVEVIDEDAPRLDAGALLPEGPATARCVQALAGVSLTLGLVRHADTLGRDAGWPDGRRLALRCVDPDLADNAFYQPGPHRLTLGVSKGPDGPTRYAADDLDVVAHETGHALLHGLAPGLLGGWHPDSVAIHEAVADLVAVLVHLDSKVFQERALGSLAAVGDSEVLASIAEQFSGSPGRPGVRSLWSGAQRPGGDGAGPVVTTVEPHAVSEVLSGALWTFVTDELTRYVDAESRGSLLPALARQFRRLLLRAFVYTPPGELTLGDVGRLIVGADRVVHGVDFRRQDERLGDAFRGRGLVEAREALSAPEIPLPPLPAGGPDDAWIRAVEAAVGRGPCDRSRVAVATFRHLVNRRGGRSEWQTDVLVRLAWPTALRIGPMGESLEVVRGATVVADEPTRAVRALIRTGGERPEDDVRREAWIAWLAERRAFAFQAGPTGARPEGLERALHLR